MRLGFFAFFFENFEFAIIAHGETKTSIVWKTSDRTAKRSESSDSWVLVIHIPVWRTVNLVTSKVIWGSFGAIAIFHDWGVMVKDRGKYFAWL